MPPKATTAVIGPSTGQSMLTAVLAALEKLSVQARDGSIIITDVVYQLGSDGGTVSIEWETVSEDAPEQA